MAHQVNRAKVVCLYIVDDVFGLIGQDRIVCWLLRKYSITNQIRCMDFDIMLGKGEQDLRHPEVSEQAMNKEDWTHHWITLWRTERWKQSTGSR